MTAPRVSNQGAVEDQDTFLGGLTPHKQVLRGNGTLCTFTARSQFTNAVSRSTLISAIEGAKGSNRLQNCGKPNMEKIKNIFNNT